MKRLGILFAAALVATPAFAKTKYEPLETREPIILQGDGGTRTSKHGIDYWTTGSPPRRHQVLGVIKDNRDNHWLSGDAVGSRKIAKLVQEAGGDGVIILNRDSKQTGTVSGGQVNSNTNATGSCFGYYCSASANGQAYGSGWSAAVVETTTSMVVVKYLPD
ncbi:hypothetical protein [Sphingopyxis sp. JAI128]|uniref:hypothetical protein n=1 Tax=Sphingopyxis sp. JAI128 TaxID=2723066 RepID=UPI00161A7B2C|nr:hypothetical protein [Sphingopyxis sp. JAI128]MBB6424980.1 hypothetical protein [Sphingopyxis sp. JAI128]